MIPAIMPLRELRAADKTFAGGKGAMLGELMHQGLDVPNGYVVTSSVFKEWLDAGGVDDKKLNSTLTKLGKNVADLEIASQLLKERVRQCSTPSTLDSLTDYLDSDKLYAVRSSGIGEDGSESSFAGQHDSFLNIHRDGVTHAIRQVWESTFATRVLYYRVAKNITSPLRQAVVIQEMVDAERAGTAFSADPRSGHRDRGLIEWVKGLGDDLVSGKQTPKTVPFKHSESIEDEVLEVVRSIVLQLQDIFGWPVDMEWAWKNGLHVLQARPITSLPTEYSDLEMELLDTAHAEYGPPLVVGQGLAPGKALVAGYVTRQLMKYWSLNKQYDLSKRVFVAPFTTPDDLPIMEKVAAVVVSRGGATSHAAIVCREMGKPCVRVPKISLIKNNRLQFTKKPMLIDGRGVIFKSKLEDAYE